MTSSVTAFRRRRTPARADTAADRERWVRRRVGAVWGLLLLNALTYYPALALIPLPAVVGKAIAQGALIAALLVALTVNRRRILRPNVFLCLVLLLVIEAFFTSLQSQYYVSTLYRSSRLAGYAATLWLLTPWWGRRDLLLVRCHLAALSVLLGSVILGLLVAPGHALEAGRLSGVLWPVPPTEVAHYAAVTIGLMVVLWVCGNLRGRVALLVSATAGAILIATHTRTALTAMVAGIVIAGMSLIVAKARVRKLFAAAGVVAAIGVMTLSGFISTWLARGEGSHELSDLTGRTTVWTALASFPRDRFQMFFGMGLSNKSFDGLAIDSNWFASYNDQGLFGMAVCAAILLFLLITAFFRPRGVERALALFLTTYCLVASFTEVGFTDVSPYLLEVTLAASLLVPSVADSRPP